MQNIPLYPFKLDPSLHVKVWGGRKLSSEMNIALPTEEPFGEAWTLHDTCHIANGALAGNTIADIVASHGAELIGNGNDPADGFPLLAKIIDASAWLSIQVHPDDAQAKALENQPRGKTEAWVVLAADDGAQLVIGVTPGTSRQAMADAIQNNTLEEYIVYADVQAGDVLYIPANTIHALGPGIVIYEIQQSSNTTYRLYDWGRMGLDGKPRELHIEKGVQVSNVDFLPDVTHPTDQLMVDGQYFQTIRHTLDNATETISTHAKFQSLSCIDGDIIVHVQEHDDITLSKGQTGLIPACLSEFTLTGTGVVLRSHQK